MATLTTTIEWHFPAHGDFPDAEAEVLCGFADGGTEPGFYDDSHEEPGLRFRSLGNLSFRDEVICWAVVTAPALPSVGSKSSIVNRKS